MQSQNRKSAQPPEVACPTCGRKTRWSTENRWRPFCSERCRLIDLGEWLSENMRIPDEPAPDDSPDDSGNPSDS